jgi:hypothetical protein
LDQAFEAMAAKYGGVAGYVERGLRVSAEERRLLRRVMVERGGGGGGGGGGGESRL